MPYNLTTYDGTSLVTIADGTVDDQATTSLFFIGKNVTGYGQDQNDNFLYLLENFANISAPTNPLAGQLWFNKTPGVRRPSVYDGANWRSLAILTASTASSNSALVGDLWFDTNKNQLWVNTGTSTFSLIGPQIVEGFKLTQAVSRSASDNGTGTHAVIDMVVDGNVVGIFSNDTFTLGGNDSDYLLGFREVVSGFTLNPNSTIAGLDIPARGSTEAISGQWNFASGIALGNNAITSDSGNNLFLSSLGNVVVNASNLVPNSPSTVIGGANTPFQTVYASGFGAGSSLTPVGLIGDFSLGANSRLRPTVDNNSALGIPTGRWSNVYTRALSAGGPTSDASLDGNWVMTSGSTFASGYIETPFFTAQNTGTSGRVEGQWTLTKNSTFQATQLIDANGNVIQTSIPAAPTTIVERDSNSQINATQFNGNVLSTAITSTNVYANLTGNVAGNVAGNVTGNLTGNVTGNLTGTAVTATNISGALTGNVTGNLTGNVTGNLTGTAVTATNISGALTGNVTGNVTGDLTGNVTGNVTGNLTGNVTGNLTGTNVVATNILGSLTGSLTGNVVTNNNGTVLITSTDRFGSGSLFINNTYGSEYGYRTQLDASGNYIINYQNASGQQTQVMSLDSVGEITATSFSGSVIGNVTGKLTGDSTGYHHGTADNAVTWAGSSKFVSTDSPDPNAGVNGDFWFQYQA